jgi:succinoglycan biosynthesis transport protein ExoP
MNETAPNSTVTNQRYISTQDALLIDRTATAGPSQYQTLSGLLGVLRQRWRMVAITGAAVFALGTAAYFLIAAYSATTIIEFNKDDPSDDDAAKSNGPALTSDDIKDEVQTGVSILETDDGLALRVIKKLNLINEPSFKKAIDPAEKDKPLDDAPRTRDKALGVFHSRLKVVSPPDTRLITITFKSPDPILATSITNTLARTFIDDTLSRRQRSIERSSAWLRHELGDLKKQVEQSEQRLADYERNTGLAGIELTGSSNGTDATTVSVTPQNTVTARLFSLNQELTQAEANRISTGAVYHLVKSQDPELVLGLGPMNVSSGNGGGSGSITPEGIELVSSLRAQESDLDRQLAASVVKYGSNNPRLLQLQQQIDAVKQQMQAELARIRLRAANNYQYAKLNEDSIRGQFTQQEAAANVMADKSVKLQLLAQEAFSNRALYDKLFSKLQTATLTSGTRATRIDIVAEAIPAGSPNVPKSSLYFAALAAIVMFFGISAAFLQESLDETVRTPQDLDEIQGLTMLGYIPRLETLPLRQTGAGASQLIDAPLSPFSEAFRGLRTSINLGDVRWANRNVFSTQDPAAADIAATGVPVFAWEDGSLEAISTTQSRTILVTSALGGAGKTTVTYNLGVAFAQQGARVLLLDGDLRNPDLHKLFSTPVAPGLSGACGNPVSAEISGIVQHSSLPGLFMLPAGEQRELPSELFGSPAFDSVLWKLSRFYDYILIDSPPILAVADASIIAAKVNAIIAVVRARNTTRPALAALAQAMQRTHAPVIGFVLNDVRQPTLNGFYDYGYSRGKEDQLEASA